MFFGGDAFGDFDDFDEFTTHAGAAFAIADLARLDDALRCLSRVPRYMTQASEHSLFAPAELKVATSSTAFTGHPAK